MYFGEENVFNNIQVSCRVTVAGNNRAALLGFTREALEQFFDKKAQKNWLQNHVLVNFPHEEEVRKETLIQWRVNAIQENALLDGLKGCYVQDEAQRDAYLNWDVRKRQMKLRPWYEAIKNQHQAHRPKIIKNKPAKDRKSQSPD